MKSKQAVSARDFRGGGAWISASSGRQTHPNKLSRNVKSSEYAV